MTAKLILFSSAHEIFSRVDYVLSYKTSLSKFKRIEIIQHVFSDHHTMVLETNNRGKFGKFTNIWKLTHFYRTSGSKKKAQKILESKFR